MSNNTRVITARRYHFSICKYHSKVAIRIAATTDMEKAVFRAILRGLCVFKVLC